MGAGLMLLYCTVFRQPDTAPNADVLSELHRLRARVQVAFSGLGSL